MMTDWGWLPLVLGPAVALGVPLAWRYLRAQQWKMDRSVDATLTALKVRFPEIVVGLYHIWEPNTLPTTASLVVLVDGDLTARVTVPFSFDLDLPVDAMRECGLDRASVCKRLVGGSSAAAFAAFLEAHDRPERREPLSPIDRDRLVEMQSIVWASFYRAGWPVLCIDVAFADIGEVLGRPSDEPMYVGALVRRAGSET